MGSNVTLHDAYLHARGGLIIGDNTFMGNQVMVLTATHQPLPLELRAEVRTAPVRIGSDVWLASRVMVLPGASIGDGSVVAAGSVVTTNIPAGVLAAGIPAKAIRVLGPTSLDS